jgi:hypothetical protein
MNIFTPTMSSASADECGVWRLESGLAAGAGLLFDICTHMSLKMLLDTVINTVQCSLPPTTAFDDQLRPLKVLFPEF